MPVRKTEYRKQQTVPVKIWTDDVDKKTLDQLTASASLPFIHKHIAAMPDVHLGLGSTVGSVIPTYKAIIPAAVGVDIGCGMNAIRLSATANQLPDTLAPIRMGIERAIPLGLGTGHKKRHHHSDRLRHIPADKRNEMKDRYQKILYKHPEITKRMKDSNSWVYQLGSLGSGNHFIEICLDEDDQVWVMLHSGSRGIGNHIGRYFIALAQKEMEVHFIQLPNRDLAYLCEGTQSFDDYVEAVAWAQDYALENRRQMMTMVLEVLRKHLPDFEIIDEGANCHHNYVALESHFGKNVYVTRKGAIRARKDDIGIIPGSMGTRSYIVRGLGDKDSFSSCSHGAGRVMSRTEAKRKFTQEDLKKQTAGIECRKDKGVIDEIPGAYKSIDEVMRNQTDLVEVLFELHQVVNVKG